MPVGRDSPDYDLEYASGKAKAIAHKERVIAYFDEAVLFRIVVTSCCRERGLLESTIKSA